MTVKSTTPVPAFVEADNAPAGDKAAFAASGQVFYIHELTQVDTKYGTRHKLEITLNSETGERSVILLGSNAGQDMAMDRIAAAGAKAGFPVGPAKLVAVQLPQGRSTFNVVPA
jgi:hypothetical protein